MARPEQFSLAWLMGQITLAGVVMGGVAMVADPRSEFGVRQTIILLLCFTAASALTGGLLLSRTIGGQIQGAALGIAILVAMLLGAVASYLWT